MKFCSGCGNKLNENQKFCSKCGNKIDADKNTNDNNKQTKKIVVVSRDPYGKDFFLNDKQVCSLKKSNEINFFELPIASYKVHFFSQHSKNNSNIETLNLNENKRITLVQGFINPKLSIDSLSDEEFEKYKNNEFIKLNNLDLQINNIQPSNPEVKSKSILSVIGSAILIIILFCFFIYLGIDGANRASHIDGDYTEKYSYTIESEGLDDNDVYVIKGKVTNNTNKDVDGLQIEFKCYDSEHNHIDTIKDYTENLNAGEKWSYEATDYFNSQKINSCEFYQITPYIKIAEIH